MDIYNVHVGRQEQESTHTIKAAAGDPKEAGAHRMHQAVWCVLLLLGMLPVPTMEHQGNKWILQDVQDSCF